MAFTWRYDVTSQLDTGAAQAPATQWRDKKRYLWLFGLVPPTALFVMLPIIWAFNQFGWTAASQAFFWVGPFLIYVLLPALDIKFGRDGQNPPDEVMEYLENDKYYRYCTYIFIPFQYATVLLGAYAVHRVEPELARVSTAAWAGWPRSAWRSSVGVLGGIGINTAHEMGHKKESAGALAVQDHPGADLLRALLHRAQPRPPRAGRHPGGPRAAPASARRFWEFLPRSVWGSLKSAWHLEAHADPPHRQEPVDRDLLRNDVLNAWADVGGALRCADRRLRPGADPVPDPPGGLRLRAAGGGQLPRALRPAAAEDRRAAATSAARPQHSWNSDHLVTNLFLYHLQRHSDHHANPTRRYQTLRSMDGAPEPAQPATPRMIGSTYFPPLWRRVMDHRVLDHYDGDITQVNIQPRGARQGPRPVRRAREPTHERLPVPGLRLRLRRGAKVPPREGFPAGTAWADVPDDWCCPDCGVREKIDFEPDGA